MGNRDFESREMNIGPLGSSIVWSITQQPAQTGSNLANKTDAYAPCIHRERPVIASSAGGLDVLVCGNPHLTYVSLPIIDIHIITEAPRRTTVLIG
jgi:hypothetical protein